MHWAGGKTEKATGTGKKTYYFLEDRFSRSREGFTDKAQSNGRTATPGFLEIFVPQPSGSSHSAQATGGSSSQWPTRPMCSFPPGTRKDVPWERDV